MKRLLVLFSCVILAVTAQATSFSFQPTDSFGGDTNTHDLGDLSHANTYTWGINGTSETSLKTQLTSGYSITSAVLTISNLYNWSSADTINQLFIHLLDNPQTGVKAVVDDPNDNGVNQGVVSDYFGGKIAGNKVGSNWVAYGYDSTGALIPTGTTNIYLTQYHDNDGPTTKVNYSFVFSVAQASILQSYIANGHTGGTSYADFGLGFDPDCHFYNNGVCLTINTAIVPVPDGSMSLALLVVGLLALWGLRGIMAWKLSRVTVRVVRARRR